MEARRATGNNGGKHEFGRSRAAVFGHNPDILFAEVKAVTSRRDEE